MHSSIFLFISNILFHTLIVNGQNWTCPYSNYEVGDLTRASAQSLGLIEPICRLIYTTIKVNFQDAHNYCTANAPGGEIIKIKNMALFSNSSNFGGGSETEFRVQGQTLVRTGEWLDYNLVKIPDTDFTAQGFSLPNSNSKFIGLTYNVTNKQFVNTRKRGKRLPVICQAPAIWGAFYPNNWTYGGESGPEYWGIRTTYKCRGKSQSPINIEERSAMNRTFKALKYTNILATPSAKTYDFTLAQKKGGRGFELVVKIPSGFSQIDARVTGSIFENNEYNFYKMDFHWGTADNFGSEHTISNNRKALEVQWIFWNRKFSNFTDSLNKEDGIAKISFLFNVVSTGNCASGPLNILETPLGQFKDNKNGNFTVTTTLNSFLSSLTNKNDYFSYYGSDTAPPCNENVKWVVYKDTLNVCQSILEKLRALSPGNYFRPVQRLGNRDVYRNI